MDIEPAMARRSTSPVAVLLTASTGCAMTVLDTNVVAVVLPSVARDLSASFAEIEWVISTYVLCFASLLLPAGAVADRYGRRRVFLVGIGIFAVTSLLCGIAPSARTLYLARALQGAGAAFLLAPALAIIGHSFHGEADRNRAWAIWGTIMGLTMVLSPVIGGVIAYFLGWRWAFHVNVPICALLGLATCVFVADSRDADARRIDPLGILLFAVSMFGVTWGLITGQSHGWISVSAMAGFIGGGLAFCAFVIVERVQLRPMLDLQLFLNPRFVGAVWAMFAYAACAQVMASILPLFFQNGLGRTALKAGFSMLPFALTMLAFPHVGRFLGRRLASPGILTLGLVLVGLGNAVTGWGAHSGAWQVVMIGMLVIGSGGGLLNGETQKAIMSVVPHGRAGMASGISTTARFSGILLGFATLNGVLATVVRRHLNPMGSAAPYGHTEGFADAVVAGDLPSAVARLAEPAQEIAMTQARHAFAAGFSTALLVAAAFALTSSLAVHFLMRKVE